MKKQITWLFCILYTVNVLAQSDTLGNENKRLDFAKMYFEMGGTFLPSFTGLFSQNNEISSFENPASVIQYLNWGGFHFWGHGEFYVTIPLAYRPFSKNEEASSEMFHSVVTGARFFPWAYRENKIRPYVGMNWSALDFQQKITSQEEQSIISKDFMLAYDAGILYGYKNFALRLGLNYLPSNTWEYPISRTQKATINTPKVGLQVGLLYSWDSTKDTNPKNIDKWNSYPTVSKQSLGSTSFGDFYIGAGPSLSFSLKNSGYNQTELPYLKEKMASGNYFDLALGYNFNKAGLFTNLSFRNPKFETEGFGTKQNIQKTALLFEVNKFLIDYSGFTPYLGLNISYDKIKYREDIDGISKDLNLESKVEPGITFGWDIQPGKNQEAVILRTNLRWYPFSSFDIEGKTFHFSQLEYNLIQVLFYPGRLKNRR